jgi:tetratricopeptide (TPR) repeat protein
VPFLAQGQWLDDRPHAGDRGGTRLARRAVELGKDDAVALTRGGHALAHFGGDLDDSVAFVDRALTLDPNLAAAWFLGGFLRTERGDPDQAIEFFTRAMRFSPLDPEMFRMQAGMALAHLLAGRFESASSWAENAYRDLPSFLLVVAIIAASHALAGRWTTPGERCSTCAGSIPRCACPISTIGFRSAGRSISRRWRRACAGLPE